MDFGPSVKPRDRLVDKQRRCSCELGALLQAIEAVAEYLRSGGQRAPDPMPPCLICGVEIVCDRMWDGKYTKELGWHCTAGCLTHFLQAKAERIREALVFLQPYFPPPKLVIVSGGHIGRPLKVMSEAAGFEVMVVGVVTGRATVPELEAVTLTDDCYVVLITTDMYPTKPPCATLSPPRPVTSG